jgi:hypothetical protein
MTGGEEEWWVVGEEEWERAEEWEGERGGAPTFASLCAAFSLPS